MATELTSVLLDAELDGLYACINEADYELEDAKRDVDYAEGEINRISDLTTATTLISLHKLQQRFNEVFKMKRKAEETINRLKPIVAELEEKIQKAEAAKAACELALALEAAT